MLGNHVIYRLLISVIGLIMEVRIEGNEKKENENEKWHSVFVCEKNGQNFSLCFLSCKLAYYYYNTEPNKNYEQTIIDVVAAIRADQIPIQYIQLDSWWYYKDKTTAVTNWDAT